MERALSTRLTDDGQEIPSDEKVAIPVRFTRADTLSEQVRRLVAGELSGLASSQGYESFDEADDFDVGDDYDPRSVHELDDEQIGYDIRYDARYQKRADESEGSSQKGKGKAESKLQPDGKKAAGDGEGDSED